MQIPFRAEKLFHQVVDFFYEKWPQPVPSKERLRSCKIISHRGEHDNITVFENTLKAFDAARECGVWGIEFDIRWTRDLQPIVFHDKSLRRIFGYSLEVGHATRDELRKSFPEIPWLEEVVERYGKKMHLMAEIKDGIYSNAAVQSRRLAHIFSRLTPGVEYHFLSLVPAMFRYLDFVPNSTYLAVSQMNIKEMSRIAIDGGYKGVAGHYLFVTGRLVKRHKANRQTIGTGYIRSRNSLFRELNRGVDWIFSNDAKKLRRAIDS